MKRLIIAVLLVLVLVSMTAVSAEGLTLHEKKCVQRAGIANMYLYKDGTSAKTLAVLVNGSPVYEPEVHGGLRVWVLAKVGVNTWREGYIDPLQCQLFDPDVPTISGAKLYQLTDGDEPAPVVEVAQPDAVTPTWAATLGGSMTWVLGALVLVVFFLSFLVRSGQSTNSQLLHAAIEALVMARDVAAPTIDNFVAGTDNTFDNRAWAELNKRLDKLEAMLHPDAAVG